MAEGSVRATGTGNSEPAGKAGVRGYGDPLQREPTKALPKALERLPQPPVGSAAR